MNNCVCGGIKSFVKAFEDGKVGNDIYKYQCGCGSTAFIVDNAVWHLGYMVTTKEDKGEYTERNNNTIM